MSAPPLTAIAAALVVRGDRVLVQTRPPGASWAGYWEFPGGKIEPGESVPAALCRECREELALAIVPGELVRTVEWSYPGTRVAVAFHLCALADDAAEPVAREGQELRWADAGDLARLRFLPANAEIVAALAERLRA